MPLVSKTVEVEAPAEAIMGIVADFEAIGMTASGKVQKTKLREHALRELKLA